MTPAIAIAKLAALGLPADRLEDAATIIDAVIATAMVGEEDRKARDRERKARKSEEQRGRDRNSAESTGTARNGSEAENAKSAVDIITTTNLDNNILPQQQHRSSRASRGTRLPEDFAPLPNILEKARSLGFTDADYWDHFERFKDYWRGVSGAKGVKLDWQGTWRNRIKDLADRKGSFNGKPPQNTIASRFAKIRSSIDEQGRSEGGDQDRREDPGVVSGLWEGPGRLSSGGR